MNSYLKMKERHQKEVNDFPIFFAFSREQFAEGMKKLGLEPGDTSQIYRLGNTGGYYRKTDAQALDELFERHAAEIKDARLDAEYVYEMFDYELANHEYCVTYDLSDTLDALGLTMEEVNENPILKEGLKKALSKYKF